MTKQLLSGNEAIAQGAWEAGVHLGVGYPGTPSTEILENLAKLTEKNGGDAVSPAGTPAASGPHCEWAPNEKVALEVGIGAAMGGLRTIVTMKHVGVNVAADPLMSVCNAGVNGGLVIVAADDPSCYSSQNEQDSRNYAAFARIPCLDPASSLENYEFIQRAFELSERFDTPVMFHETMRIAHTKTMVEPRGQRAIIEPRAYEPQPQKYVMMPAMAVARRKVTDQRERDLIAYAETSDLNVVEMRDEKVGVICAGAVYQHVREALPEASVLKLGLTWPLPPQKIRDFAASVEKCYVVEEACDYFSLRVRAMGVDLATPPAHPLPPDGEIIPSVIRDAFGVPQPAHAAPATDLPPRPPAFCPGCPHRLVFSTLRDLKCIVMGDIGCYTLGAVAPLGACHAVIDMGASLSMAHGMELAGVPERNGRPVVGVIGDSTFAHSGITSMLGTIYNAGAGTLCILDNRTTAMTGQQGNPCNGLTLMESARRMSPLDVPAGKPLDLVALALAMGVEDVQLVDSQNAGAVKRALQDAIAAKDRLSLVIFKSPCRLLDRSRNAVPVVTDCRKCGRCINLGCPALGRDAEGRAQIDPNQCVGCGQCVQTCPFKFIQAEGAGFAASDPADAASGIRRGADALASGVTFAPAQAAATNASTAKRGE